MVNNLATVSPNDRTDSGQLGQTTGGSESGQGGSQTGMALTQRDPQGQIPSDETCLTQSQRTGIDAQGLR